MWYFSYGTDLSDELLQAWGQATGSPVPRLTGRTPAVLANHRLCFSQFDDVWGGGAADIVPQAGKSVSGALVRLGERSAELLDRLAGRRVDRWGRECGVRRLDAVRVHPTRGEPVAAHTFVLQRSADRLIPPTAAYQQRIADAAGRVGLSQFWVMQLLGFPNTGEPRVPLAVATDGAPDLSWAA